MPKKPLTGALPAYLQVSEALIRDIAAGRYRDGDRLPPEREMATGLGIAVGTLRKALAELEDRGLLERRQGSGNYIRQAQAPEAIYAFFRLELLTGGGLPTARALSVARMDKPAHLPAFGTSDQAHRIRRLRRLSGQPASIEEIWLDASFAPRLDPAELSDSLYLYYREALGLWITGYEDRVGTAPVPDWAPADFAPRPGRCCAMVERLSRARDGQVVEVSHNWFDSDIARYVARIG